MAITRVTQRMLSQRALGSVQGGLNRMAKVQEQLETGKKINRPSDSPSGTNTALRKQGLSAEQAAQKIDVTAYREELPSIRGVGIDPAAVRRIYQLADHPE